MEADLGKEKRSNEAMRPGLSRKYSSGRFHERNCDTVPLNLQK